MTHWFYALPLWQMIALCLIGVAAWGLIGRFVINRNKKAWQIINICCALLFVTFIVHQTIVGRGAGNGELILTPLNNFAEAKVQPEMYRSMLANVCLFVPLGAFVGNALVASEGKFVASINKRNIVAMTAIAGLGLSLVIEMLQFAYGIGRAEVDDLLCNTLGMFIGSLSVLLEDNLAS